ncbi:hypothetical protein MRX96_052964 [Rhipicephalus microplus]
MLTASVSPRNGQHVVHDAPLTERIPRTPVKSNSEQATQRHKRIDSFRLPRDVALAHLLNSERAAFR